MCFSKSIVFYVKQLSSNSFVCCFCGFKAKYITTRKKAHSEIWKLLNCMHREHYYTEFTSGSQNMNREEMRKQPSYTFLSHVRKIGVWQTFENSLKRLSRPDLSFLILYFQFIFQYFSFTAKYIFCTTFVEFWPNFCSILTDFSLWAFLVPFSIYFQKNLQDLISSNYNIFLHTHGFNWLWSLSILRKEEDENIFVCDTVMFCVHFLARLRNILLSPSQWRSKFFSHCLMDVSHFYLLRNLSQRKCSIWVESLHHQIGDLMKIAKITKKI